MGGVTVLSREGLQKRAVQARFMGLKVDCLGRRETVELLVRLIEDHQAPILHSVINAAKVVQCQANPELRQAINAGDIVSADGQAVVWFGRWAGIPVPERVTGIDLMTEMLGEAEHHGWRVFLWGASDAVVRQAATRIQDAYPGLAAVGTYPGYFVPSEEESICRQIAAWRPDIVFLGMNTPKKELISYRRLQALGSRLVMGVGGAFDIWAGRTARAPRIWQRLGLEWLYRLLLEPRRMARRYLVGNVLFVCYWLGWIRAGKPAVWGQEP